MNTLNGTLETATGRYCEPSQIVWTGAFKGNDAFNTFINKMKSANKDAEFGEDLAKTFIIFTSALSDKSCYNLVHVYWYVCDHIDSIDDLCAGGAQAVKQLWAAYLGLNTDNNYVKTAMKADPDWFTSGASQGVPQDPSIGDLVTINEGEMNAGYTGIIIYSWTGPDKGYHVVKFNYSDLDGDKVTHLPNNQHIAPDVASKCRLYHQRAFTVES
jgi:hypothetical protein